jgi:hypothetical protein
MRKLHLHRLWQVSAFKALFVAGFAAFLAAFSPVDLNSTVAFAQSPLELLQQQQGVGSSTRRASSQRRNVNRGRGIFSGIPGFGSDVFYPDERPNRDAGQRNLRSIDDLLRRNKRRKNPSIITLNKDDSSGEPSEIGTTSYCVRTCDGFFFPVGSPDDGGDKKAHEIACNSFCPSAETRLYIATAGSDGIKEATAGGQSYSRLPTAFAYRNGLSKACTCNGKTPFGLAQMPVMKDFTLEQGDVVMTTDGLKVLASQRYPYKEKNFVPATWSKRLSSKERDGMIGIENGGRKAKLSERDKRNSAKAAELVGKLLNNGDSETLDPQLLVRYLGPNAEEEEALIPEETANAAETENAEQ